MSSPATDPPATDSPATEASTPLQKNNAPPIPSLSDTSYMITDNCIVKALFAGGGGLALGLVFGTFISATSSLPEELHEMPFRKQVTEQFKSMCRSSWSMAKNFALVGLLFAGSECAIEQVRGKTDAWGSVAAGCFSGSVLAVRAGPQAMLVGCTGFAAFSAAIDYFTGRHDETMRVKHDSARLGPIDGSSVTQAARTLPGLFQHVARQYAVPQATTEVIELD